MTKKILLLALIILLTGCAKKVSFELSDELSRYKPVSVVVMPVTVDSDPEKIEADVLRLVRSTAQDKLLEKGYSSFPLEEYG